MAYNITLTGKNKIEALELLEFSAKIIDRCNINYWLEGGTLLGIRRENRLLPWDNDIDISMMFPGDQQLETLIKAFKNSGARVRVRKFKATDHPFLENSFRIIKIRNKRFFGLLKGNVCLDIFVKHCINNKAYWKIGDNIKSVPIKYYNSLKQITFNNYSYSVPELTDNYLTYRYKNWEIPKKDWNTFTDDNALN